MQIEIGGQKIDARGLTRGELKTLRAEGIVLTEIESLPEEEREKALDRIFSLACPGLDADSLTPGQALELYIGIIGLCYAQEDLLKKFASPPRSSSPRGGSSAESAKGPDSRPRGTARRSKKRHG